MTPAALLLFAASACFAQPQSPVPAPLPDLPPAPVASPQAPPPLFTDSFATQDGLITNAYALWHSTDPRAMLSTDWQVISGSLFAQRGQGFTGVPDDTQPNAGSTNGTGSAVFRVVTARGDFTNVDVSFDLDDEVLTESNSTPKQPWDGAHVIVRYQDESHFYYASVDRRDDTALIKKKVGPTFWDLTPAAPAGVPYGQWQKVKVRVKDNPDGSVSLWLWRDGRLLAQAVDTGYGGPPYRGPGRVGLRGDNARLRFGHFRVDAVGTEEPATAGAAGAPPAPVISGLRAVDVTTGSANIVWLTDLETLDAVDYGSTASLGIEGLWSQGALRGHSVLLTGLLPKTQYYFKARAKTPAGAVQDSAVLNFTTLAEADTLPPTVSIVSPQNGQTLGGTIGLVCNAQDNTAVAGVQWEVDGTSVGLEVASPPYSYYWNTQETYNGPHTVRAIARDTSNNRSVSAPITITITGAKPRY
jgi:hypothetical protein